MGVVYEILDTNHAHNVYIAMAYDVRKMADHNYFRKQLDLSEEVDRLTKFLQQTSPAPHSPSPLQTCEERDKVLVLTHCQEVWPVLQKGPMCGLVALTMATQLLRGTRDRDEGAVCVSVDDRHHPERILEYAQHEGLSKQGEIFSAKTLVDICTDHLHVKAHVLNMDAHGDTIREILERIISGRTAVVVPYDADKNHTPCLAGGHKAHWCLLVGLCLVLKKSKTSGTAAERLLKYSCPVPDNPTHRVLNGECLEEFSKFLTEILSSQSTPDLLKDDWIHVFARQGKSTHLGLWSLRDLVQSNGNLLEVDPKRSNPQEYVLPEGGRLREGLGNKLVFISRAM